jgi:hypothetical protein
VESVTQQDQQPDVQIVLHDDAHRWLKADQEAWDQFVAPTLMQLRREQLDGLTKRPMPPARLRLPRQRSREHRARRTCRSSSRSGDSGDGPPGEPERPYAAAAAGGAS